MNEKKPTLYTIPSGESFVEALARGILAQTRAQAGTAPEALARVHVLLPTRRACRSLREAFLRLSGAHAMLLPIMVPLGDVEADDLVLESVGLQDTLDIPPAIATMKRTALLARYVRKMDPDTTPDQAVRLAEELAHLVDQVHTEGLDLRRLPELVEDADLSQHWMKTVEFLKIVGETWPEVLAGEGALDPAKRRDVLLRARARAWREHPPANPVIAAGSTGTIPATAELLGVVAHLPQGAVVLPGLDREATAEVWDNLDATHPQYGLAKLLAKLDVGRAEVALWPGASEHTTARRNLLNAALVPASATHLWRMEPTRHKEALNDFTRIDCAGPREEAATIALILRGALEDPENHPARTAALITPDRHLARRVTVEMRRWGIDIDDSAGTPLPQTPPGAFFNLVADMVARRFHPVAVLACLKHPLAAGGLTPRALRSAVRALETACLRGPQPGAGLGGLENRLRVFLNDKRQRHRFTKMGFHVEQPQMVLDLLHERVGEMAKAFANPHHTDVDPGELLRLHAAAAEAMADSGVSGDERRLWTGDAGESLSAFIAEAFEAVAHIGPLRAEQYPVLIHTLMAHRAVRPRYARHPRVHIWGLLEARLQHADILVLGGLNEGTWPAASEASPWMSRPMMHKFGLPSPERGIGLSAHDFVQAACATRVFVTRARRANGTPQTPARWLVRLDTMLGEAAVEPDKTWPAWAESLNGTEAPATPCLPPHPRPPVAVRPRRLSVTSIEKWVRDPYAIYARHILKLQPLDPIAAEPGAADLGNVIHTALERFMKRQTDILADDALAKLLKIGETAFHETLSSPAVQALWWPRFKRIAQWFVSYEQGRRQAGFTPILIEQSGEISIDGLAGPFTLSAKIDRCDKSAAGGLVLIDYKTGGVPSKPQVESGLSPQLPLEAFMAQRGAFSTQGLAPGLPIEALVYIRLSGTRIAGEEISLKLDAEDTAHKTYENLVKLIHRFDDEPTPYLSRPRAMFESRYGDYDHLARVKEWADEQNGQDGEA